MPNHRGTKKAVVYGGGGGRRLPFWRVGFLSGKVWDRVYKADYVSLEWVITFGKLISDMKN